MKNLYKIAILLAAIAPAAAFAQGPEDAFRFSDINYTGTARTVAMGSAFTAVGGDLGAVSINPASSAVLRTSQFTVTPGSSRSFGATEYLGNKSSNHSQNNTILSNIAAGINFETGKKKGIVNFNVGMAVSRVADFSSTLYANGFTEGSSWLTPLAVALDGTPRSTVENISFTDTNLPWAALLAWDAHLIDEWGDGTSQYVAATENLYEENGTEFPEVGGLLNQDFHRLTSGGITEIAFNFAANQSDNFFFGANLNMYSLTYSSDESYMESTTNSSDFQTGFRELNHRFSSSTSGAGVNLKVGVIYLPTRHLRLGATYTTPTIYSISETWSQSLMSFFKGDGSSGLMSESPINTYDYQLITPQRLSLGVAYTLGTAGLISVDYENVNYGALKMTEDDGRTGSFAQDNDYIRSEGRNTDILRIGAEWNLSRDFALRGGYNYYTPNTSYAPDRKVYSWGIGYKVSKSCYFDFAYRAQETAIEKFTLYDDTPDVAAPVGTWKKSNKQILFTLGFKF